MQITLGKGSPFSKMGGEDTFYAVSTQDRTINPDLQRFMAKRVVVKRVGDS